MASELTLVDEKRNMGGSVDFIIKTARSGAVTIGDLKTVQTVDALKRRKPATEQLGAYIRMVNQHYGMSCIIEKAVTVVAAPGECKVITSDVDACSVAWEDAWLKYEQHQKMTIGF